MERDNRRSTNKTVKEIKKKKSQKLDSTNEPYNVEESIQIFADIIIDSILKEQDNAREDIKRRSN